MGPLAYYMADGFFIPNPPLIRVHVKVNPKANVLNMNSYYVTVVDCLRVASRKIPHDSFSSNFSNSTCICTLSCTLTCTLMCTDRNLQKVFYNSQASVGDKQYTIILFISIIILHTILN